MRITYPGVGRSTTSIRHIWLLLAATGGVVLGIVFLASLLLARSVTKPLDDLERRGRRARRRRPRARAPRCRRAPPSSRCSPSRSTPPRRASSSSSARSARSSPTRRTSCARRWPRCGSGSRTSRPTCTAPPPRTSTARSPRCARLSRLVDGLLVLDARRAVDVGARRRSRSTSVHRRPLRRVGRVRRRAARAHRAPTSTGSPVARATPGRLEQVVDNLLNNALEVAPAGSAVRRRRDRSSGDWVELRVSDEGPGMTADERARAFDRFWQSGGARTRRSPERSLRPRALDRARARGRRRRRRRGSSRRRPAGSRWWCGCGAATSRLDATRASVSSRPPRRPERRRRRSTTSGWPMRVRSTRSASVKPLEDLARLVGDADPHLLQDAVALAVVVLAHAAW